MGDLHRLPTARDAAVRLLQRAVERAVAAHPDPRAAMRWAAMARESIARHPGPPVPTRPVLDLDALPTLSDAGRADVARAVETWFGSYVEDVRAQLLDMHREALALQRRVAELEVRLEDDPDDDVMPAGMTATTDAEPVDAEPADAAPRSPSSDPSGR